jgi:pectate lyase
VLLGESDAVFVVERGATLRNVIIGKNQMEGVYCKGPCTLEFVCESNLSRKSCKTADLLNMTYFLGFEDVCEDAISVVSHIFFPETLCKRNPLTICIQKEDRAGDHTWIIGGGAFKAADKVVQHNGCGTVNIINFYAQDYGKLYRSCGNCSSQCKRNVYIEGVTARKGSGKAGELAGINRNYGDTATLRNVCTDNKTPCVLYDGCAGGCEPQKVGTCSG